MMRNVTVRRMAGIAGVAALVLAIYPPLRAQNDPSQPGEAVEVRWREAFVTVERTVSPAPELAGHVVGTSRQRGFAFMEDGQVARATASLAFQAGGEELSYRGVAHYRFGDGSTKIARFDGGGDPAGEQTGTFRFVDGTGRFQGIEGEGTFTGRAFRPDGDIYLDILGEYRLPN